MHGAHEAAGLQEHRGVVASVCVGDAERQDVGQEVGLQAPGRQQGEKVQAGDGGIAGNPQVPEVRRAAHSNGSFQPPVQGDHAGRAG